MQLQMIQQSGNPSPDQTLAPVAAAVVAPAPIWNPLANCTYEELIFIEAASFLKRPGSLTNHRFNSLPTNLSAYILFNLYIDVAGGILSNHSMFGQDPQELDQSISKAIYALNSIKAAFQSTFSTTLFILKLLSTFK